MFLIDRLIALLTKGRGIFSFALCVAVSLYLLFSDTEGKRLFHEVAIVTILAPVQTVLNFKDKFLFIYRENKALQIENAGLKVDNDRLRHFSRQNLRLRQMLQFRSVTNYNLVSGEIIARDPGRFETTWIINLGIVDSVGLNMPVLTTRGVVGKVSESYRDYSLVQLIQHPNCKISVVNLRSGLIGLLESYQIDRLIARFPAYSDVLYGDTLVTSGMGGVFPKGLSVGVVAKEDLDSDDILKGAEVVPFQDRNLVEEVFVFRKEASWKLKMAGN